MRVAVTGASGSLGRQLIRRLAQSGAERIVAFSRDEQRRAQLLADFGWHPGVRVFAGDVRDRERLRHIFAGCDTVIHAAARKVVSALPDEAREMLLTNVEGTLNVIDAAQAARAGKLLFISSDKAVEPHNVYGVSKAMAEHLIINENARTYPSGLRMAVLRYGNVLASRGSVVQVWRERLARGLRLGVSDERMTRFWMTLGQCVDFVLGALADLRGGEVFVPYALPAAPITVLAQALGAESWDVTGIRPGGEKLHESLLSAAEVTRARVRNLFWVVPPYQHDHMWDNAPWIGSPAAPDFCYASGLGPFLDAEGMRALLARVDAEEVAWNA
jgi:UDP-N-acetylglucosamine 4,6-dehydratase